MADISRTLPLERSSVEAAYKLIKPYVHRTPVLTCKTLNDLASTPQTPEALTGTPFEGQAPAHPKINFFFKCENFQRIGAFKIRGASHALARLSDEELKNGVVTHSSGNHAQALALAARTRGIHAYIVMPTISTPSKIAATKGYGAEVIFSGSTSEEREAVVEGVIKRTGAVLIPPYDHPDIILGQGTVGLEMEEQVAEMTRENPELSVHYDAEKTPRDVNGGATNEPSKGDIDADVETNGVADDTNSPPHSTKHHNHNHNHKTAPLPSSASSSPPPPLSAIIAPLGGGGLLSGLATYFSPSPTLLFGAEPSHQHANDAQLGLSSTPPQRIPHVSSLTIADGLRTPVGLIPWSIISDRNGEKVTGVYSVTDAQIVRAMRLVVERMKIVVEPSGVVGLAVALWDEGFRRVCAARGEGGWDLGVVLSGGNVGVEAVGRLFGGGGGGEG